MKINDVFLLNYITFEFSIFFSRLGKLQIYPNTVLNVDSSHSLVLLESDMKKMTRIFNFHWVCFHSKTSSFRGLCSVRSPNLRKVLRLDFSDFFWSDCARCLIGDEARLKPNPLCSHRLDLTEKINHTPSGWEKKKSTHFYYTNSTSKVCMYQQIDIWNILHTET